MSSTEQQALDVQCINTIRMLSADAVEKANSGHPGLPMGAAAFAYTLWDRHLKFNPKNPDWINRDRFVLSAGHGSMLLYSLLHLTGYGVSLDNLKQFRQWGSITPGHPEHGMTPGVETTTGPLGQGFANAIGMALAEKWLAQKFNTPDFKIVDYYTYALVSDGDLMEGVSAEAASYAGKLGLGKAIFLYDDNNISIEGSTEITFAEDVQKRFDAYGWHTVKVDNGNDVAAVSRAIEAAQADERPSLILLTTTIGFGSPNKQGTAGVHGSPLGQDELAKTKVQLGWPAEPSFFVPDEVLAHTRRHVELGKEREIAWNERMQAYITKHPELGNSLKEYIGGTLSDDFIADLPVFESEESMATREASGKAMNALAPHLQLLVGGSADLGPSNNTHLNDFGNITAQKWESNPRNLHFGVREHAMASIANGIALSGLRPFVATFLIFSDYMRGALRLSALMHQPVTYIFTHDSIGQGEDGATHQPVEHLASLRAIPGLTVIRPGDANETVAAWKVAVQHTHGPVALVLSRQKLPTLDRKKYKSANGLERGAYVLHDSEGTPDLIIIASGSEVAISLDAAEILSKDGVAVRVVSMPSWELFASQDAGYQDEVLPPLVKKRIAVEAASSFGWERYIGEQGVVVGIDTFGASAPGEVLMREFGFTTENIVARAKELLS